MISYNRDPQQTIPTSAVKIIGLGGAGANMLERIALDGLDGAELLAINTDVRTLNACLAPEKIQLGINLTRGLGTGGDPELGQQAMLEAEQEIRASLKGRRIVFLCTGLGGGTGSGAAPIVTRIAREEGAFVVVFATMPFAFEGRRRRDQAETALNELAVLSNALVTFDNNRMGELVLAKQGIHEAFSSADFMICESIKAVIRLVVRPGLINVGLDELVSALRTNRSRCLFGSGIANGKDRAARALRNALGSPLLDQGALLKDAQSVLVHLCGGEDLTLFEIELLMQQLLKFVPEKAHILFGAAVDPSMGDSLSITLISALPEDTLTISPRDSEERASFKSPLLDPSDGFSMEVAPPAPVIVEEQIQVVPLFEFEAETLPAEVPATISLFEPEPPLAPAEEEKPQPPPAAKPAPVSSLTKFRQSAQAAASMPSLFDDEEPPFAEPAAPAKPIVAAEPASAPPEEKAKETPAPSEPPAWTRSPVLDFPDDLPEDSGDDKPAPSAPEAAPPSIAPAPAEPPKLKLGVRPAIPKNELSFDAAPRGRFEGENPNVFEGEDLDLPPFLRKKR